MLSAATYQCSAFVLDFVAKTYYTQVENGRKYLCGGNAFWASLFWTPCKGVPINRRAARSSASSATNAQVSFLVMSSEVMYLTDYFFGNPKCLPGTQLIAIESLESSPEFLENRGRLKCLSPEET